jgi:DNA modification methylase
VWLPGSIKPQIDPTRKPPKIGDQLIRVARTLRRDCLLEHPKLLASAEILLGDATHLRYRESFDAVLTSPPYFVTYDYFDVQRLTYLAFGWPVHHDNQVGRSSRIDQDGYGFLPPSSLSDWYFEKFNREDTVLGRALRLYVQAMERHLRAAHRALAPGGVAAYAVADSVRLGEHFPLVAALKELAGRVGFSRVEIEPRAVTSRRILPPGRSRMTGRFTRGRTHAIREAVIFARK